MGAMSGRKFASVAGTVTVAGIAAYASYEHMRSLSLHAGQSPSIAALLPLSVDGLVVVASVAIVDGRERKGSAWAAFVLGVVVSLVANVLAAGPTLTDRCVSAWPSVALLATVEVIARGGKRAAILPAKPQATPVVKADKPPVRKAATKAKAAATIAASRPNLTTTEIAKLAGVSTRTARRAVNGHDVLEAVK